MSDLALLRAVIAYGRANGWRPVDRWPGDETVCWCAGPDVEPGVPGRYVVIGRPDPDATYPAWTVALERPDTQVSVYTVREAVDVLVALGYGHFHDEVFVDCGRTGWRCKEDRDA